MRGDNGEPPVKSIGYLAYDDRFFYVAFEFADPDPSAIRAPLGDRDSIRGSRMDFAAEHICCRCRFRRSTRGRLRRQYGEGARVKGTYTFTSRVGIFMAINLDHVPLIFRVARLLAARWPVS